MRGKDASTLLTIQNLQPFLLSLSSAVPLAFAVPTTVTWSLGGHYQGQYHGTVSDLDLDVASVVAYFIFANGRCSRFPMESP